MSVRVTIRLDKFFKDYRKEAIVFVNPQFKYVVDFEKHIQKLFNIQSSIYLTVETGSLLPSQECIQVIRSGDVIVVNKTDAGGLINGVEVLSLESGNELNNTIETIDVENHSNDESNPMKRGKRIRKRKRKQATGNDVEVQEAQTNLSRQEDHHLIVQSKKLLKESKKLMTELSVRDVGDVSSKRSNSHIRFSNDATETDKSSPSNHLDSLQARVIRPVVVLTDAGYSVVPPDDRVVSRIETGASTQQESKQEWNEGIVSLKKFANDSNFEKIVASIDFENMVKNIDASNAFVTLKEEPKTYDVVGFKMLKIGKNYEPQLSEWIIAMVKDVDDPANITLQILAGKDETSCPDGKLSMEICEEDTEPSDLITLERSDMLNVKVFVNQ